MGDYPDRSERKQEIKIHIDCHLKESLIELAQEFGKSQSATAECVIFLVKSEYETCPKDSLMKCLRSYKIRRYENNSSFTEYPQEVSWHLTLDRDAVRFCSMLRQRYPLIFNSRSMAICLCLAHAKEICKTDYGRKHFLDRLKDILDLHPVRELGSKPQLNNSNARAQS